MSVIPKSSDTVRFAVAAWMSVVSAICQRVRCLSYFKMSLTVWMFSVLGAFLGPLEWCSSSTVFLPRLNSASQLFTTLNAGALSPNVASISSWIALPHIPLRNIYFITARFSNLSIFTLFSSEYHLLNFIINQRQNKVICVVMWLFICTFCRLADASLTNHSSCTNFSFEYCWRSAS